MAIFNKLTIKGTEYSDGRNLTIKKNTGESNSASTFQVSFDNQNGRYSNVFNVGDEVVIYADLDVNPAVTKIFTGILEDIDFKGKGTSGIKGERLTLRGRDYSARLMDSTVQPVTYQNQEVSVIVLDIMSTNVDDITVNNVNTTGTTLTFIQFTQKNVFDALRELSELSGFIFYIDENKDLHFEEKSTISTGTTLDNSNVIKSRFKETRKEMVNKVWVYGSRVNLGMQDTFTADGVGSVFTLTRRGDSTAGLTTTVAGTIQMGGGALDSSYSSGTDYLFDEPNKNIVFVSGGSPGIDYSSIPTNGQSVVVDYFFTNPIVKFGQDDSSLNVHGPKTKVIVDENITDPQLAKDRVTDILNRFGNPISQGNLEIFGLPSLIAGQTIVVNLPNEEQSSQTYDLLTVEYNFDTKRMFKNSVIKVKVARKLTDILDTIKELIQSVKALQTGDISTADIVTRLQYATGSVSAKVFSWFVKTRTTEDSYIPAGSNLYNYGRNASVGFSGNYALTGSVENIILVGDRRSILTTQESGGTF
jgi:hypothetical protein